MKRRDITSLILAALAAVLTVLGGMVLAVDDSLWPLDGYVLYGGQLLHIVACVYSAVALVRGLRLRGFGVFSGFWFGVTSGVFALALVLFVFTWRTFFAYGIIPR